MTQPTPINLHQNEYGQELRYYPFAVKLDRCVGSVLLQLDEAIRFWDRDIEFSDILLGKKLYKEKYENILIYGISYKTSTGAKLLRIRFDQIDGFIKIHDKIRNLILFNYSYCDKICNKMKYLLSEKSGITDSINHNLGRIRIDSYDSLPIEKILAFHNVVVLIKSVKIIRIKTNTTLIHFQKKVCKKMNPTQNIFK